MYECDCQPLPDSATLQQRREFIAKHYPGVNETFALATKIEPLSIPDRQARLYRHRHVYKQAVAFTGGVCPACGKETARFTADFSHTGEFRGALCRACHELAKMIQIDRDGQVTWWMNSRFCIVVSGWVMDNCRWFSGHIAPTTFGDVSSGVCDDCRERYLAWRGLGAYLASYEGVEWPASQLFLHVDDDPPPSTPTTRRGVEPSGPTPLFLAPAPD